MNQQLEKRMSPSAVSSLFIATLIAVATMIIWGAVAQLATQLSMTFSDADSVRHSLEFDEGTPIIRIEKQQSNAYTRTYTDLNGTGHDQPEFPGLHSRMGVGPPRSVSLLARAYLPYRRVRWIASSHDDAEIWFVVHDGRTPGSAWFECYSTAANARITCLGTAGATQRVPATTERFPVSLEDFVAPAAIRGLEGGTNLHFYASGNEPPVVYFAAADCVRRINIRDRSVAVVCETPQNFVEMTGSLKGEWSPERFRGRRQKFDPAEWYVLCRTTDSIIRTDAAGNERLAIDLPEDIRNLSLTYFERLNGTAGLVATSEARVAALQKVHGAVLDVTDEGDLINRQNYAWINRFHRLSETGIEVSLAACNPAPMLAGALTFRALFIQATWPLRRLWLVIPVALLSGIAGVWLMQRHSATHSRTRSLLWLVFTFLFGVFGYLGYRYHRRWLPLSQQVDSEEEFAGPELLGTEIFA